MISDLDLAVSAIPVPSDGQHTIVVAFTVDDQLLDDPAGRRRVAAHAAACAMDAMAELDRPKAA